MDNQLDHACGYKVLSILLFSNSFTLSTRLLGLVHQSKLYYATFQTMSTTSLGRVIKVQDDTLLSQCCRGSGQSMTSSMAPAQDCKPIPMPSFEPRAFPPPFLTGVPIEYIVGQLHNFASLYWDKPETADCTISTCFHQLSCLQVFSLASSRPFPSSSLNT